MKQTSQSHHLQYMVERYRESGMLWPTTARTIAKWAIGNGLWQPHRDSMEAQCAEQLSRAMREEYYKDPQGRTVRTKHAARIDDGDDQMVLWADIRTADTEHMQIAFAQRREQIVGDCKQLKTDVDSFNDNAAPVIAIQIPFNFEQDLLELEAAEAMVNQAYKKKANI